MLKIFGWCVLMASFGLYPLLGILVIEYYVVGYGLMPEVAGVIIALYAVLQFMLSKWIDELEAQDQEEEYDWFVCQRDQWHA